VLARDLQLWLDFRNYENADRDISRAARNVLENHLWYLSDELVGLSLFSDIVSPVKSAIVKGLIQEPGRRNIHGDSSIWAKPDVSLGDFATTRTASLLCHHDSDNTFFALPPERWPTSELYLSGQA